MPEPITRKPARPATIAAVVPAAGRSRRMGAFKPLVRIGRKPMIFRVVDTLLAAGIDPVIVVVGHCAADLEKALSARQVKVVFNPDFRRGEMISSVKVGLAAAPRNTSGFLIALADHPYVQASTIASMIAEFRRKRSRVVVPVCSGRRGHPILLAAGVAREAHSLAPDQTLKTLVERHAARTTSVAVDDPGIHADLDTPTDRRRAADRDVLHRSSCSRMREVAPVGRRH